MASTGKDGSNGQRKQPRRRTTPASAAEREATSSPASDGSTEPTLASSGSGSPLEFEAGTFTPPNEPPPVRSAADLDERDLYEVPPPELIDWNPERAAAIVRAGGFTLHTLDPVSREPGGDELWSATQADVDAIAPPLARLLNRYAPARRLAGYSDEAELIIGVLAYGRRNVADRGRLLAEKTKREQAIVDSGTGAGGAGFQPWGEQLADQP